MPCIVYVNQITNKEESEQRPKRYYKQNSHSKQEKSLRFKCIAGKLPTDIAAHEEDKAMIAAKESWKKLRWDRNLLDDNPYILNNPIMGKTWYESRIHAKNSLIGSIKMVFYFLNGILNMKKPKTNEMLVWIECWRLMLMTGQTTSRPKR